MQPLKAIAAIIILFGFLCLLGLVALKRELCGQPKPYDVEDDS